MSKEQKSQQDAESILTSSMLKTSGKTIITIEGKKGEIHFPLKLANLSPVSYPIYDLIQTDSSVTGKVRLFEGNVLLKLNATLVQEGLYEYEVSICDN